MWRLFLDPLWGNYSYGMHFPGRPCVFSDESNKALPLMLIEKNASPSVSVFLSLHPLYPEPGRQLFSPAHGRRGWMLNWGIWLSVRTIGNCTPVGSWQAGLVKWLTPSFPRQAHHWLCFSLAMFLSPSVHKGLNFSLEAWGVGIKQFYYCF